MHSLIVSIIRNRLCFQCWESLKKAE